MSCNRTPMVDVLLPRAMRSRLLCHRRGGGPAPEQSPSAHWPKAARCPPRRMTRRWPCFGDHPAAAAGGKYARCAGGPLERTLATDLFELFRKCGHRAWQLGEKRPPGLPVARGFTFQLPAGQQLLNLAAFMSRANACGCDVARRRGRPPAPARRPCAKRMRRNRSRGAAGQAGRRPPTPCGCRSTRSTADQPGRRTGHHPGHAGAAQPGRCAGRRWPPA
jgi:hypothetical protein